MSLPDWLLVLGLLLLGMVLGQQRIAPAAPDRPMVYLAAAGCWVPPPWGALRPDPFLHAAALENIAEMGLLVSCSRWACNCACPCGIGAGGCR
jgi:hypothetical protein